MCIRKLYFIALSTLLLSWSTGVSAQNNSKLTNLAILSKSTQGAQQHLLADRFTFPWQPSDPEEDIAWKRVMWWDVDIKDSGNEAFASLGKILTDGLFNGSLKAYDGADDLFSNQLSKEDYISLLAHGTSGRLSGINPDSIHKFRIKEEWSFSITEQKINFRILGIAPLAEAKEVEANQIVATILKIAPMIKIKEEEAKKEEQPVMWFYYPECRKYLATRKVSASEQSWDELFQERNFWASLQHLSVTLVRSIDNSDDKINHDRFTH